jgi:hypothetical protein
VTLFGFTLLHFKSRVSSRNTAFPGCNEKNWKTDCRNNGNANKHCTTEFAKQSLFVFCKRKVKATSPVIGKMPVAEFVTTFFFNKFTGKMPPLR